MSQHWLKLHRNTFLAVSRKNTRDRIEKDIVDAANRHMLTRDELIDIQLVVEESLSKHFAEDVNHH